MIDQVIFSASFVEIYNENVLDLLDSNPHRRPLPVRMQADRGFHVGNLFVIECHTEDDMLAVLEEGQSIHTRSRSHSLVRRRYCAQYVASGPNHK